MIALIKNGAYPISGLSLPALAATTTPHATIDPKIVALEEEVTALKRTLADANARAAADIANARTAGRAAALDEYERDDAKALDALKTALGASHETLAARLNSLEQLALALSETALAQAFGDTKDYRDQIERAIRHQIAQLSADSVIKLSVSADDFPHTSLLDGLHSPNVEVITDPALSRGVCRINLRLGAIDIDLPEFWRAVRRRFSALAEDGAS